MLGDNTLFDRAKIGRGLTMASSKDCTHFGCAKKVPVSGFPTRTRTKIGGLAGINFYGCTAKVQCLILCASPQLIPRILQRAYSRLWKVGVSVS